MNDNDNQDKGGGVVRPFRRAVLRGLGVVMPPLLTIILLLWLWNAVETYVLGPLERGGGHMVVWWIKPKLRTDQLTRIVPQEGRLTAMYGDEAYVQLPSEQWVPRLVFETVQKSPGEDTLRSAYQYWFRYVQIRFLRRSLILPVFLCLFILVLYFLGKFMAAGVGRMAWTTLEMLIERLPIIRNIYSSIKQVTDFVFKEREVGFNRVVAVQYPRRGIWTVAFVTGESMLEVRAAANEPVLSLLIPTSPMPATGFTITVLKSETVDLDITIDQAIQFIISCGVVVPPQQLYSEGSVQAKLASIALRRGGATSAIASADASTSKPGLPQPEL